MKKIENLFNRKIIVYLGFFIIFSFLPICKAHAADFLQVVSSTGPTSNVATTSQTLNFSITLKAPQLTATPDVTDTNYDVYFQPYCGTNSASGATYIVSSMSKVTAQNTTFTRSWTLPNGGGCPLGTKTFRWELYEVNNVGGKIYTYADKSFTYGVNTNYQGYYYIYQKPNGTYYLFSVAGRFADQQLCTTDADNFVAQNPDYTIYRACQYYDSIPETDTAEFVNISAIKKDTSKNTYTLLAPIGKITVAPDNIGDYFNTIFLIAIGLCGALAVIMIVIGGVQYMGDESIFGKTEAKSRIMSAILGLLIALGAYALLNTINPDLLGKSGVNIKQVSAVISAEDTSTGSSTSLCLSTTNPPDPNTATGNNLPLNATITGQYIPALNQISGLSTGAKLLITAQTAMEGFSSGTKSYTTNNPGNIGNTDNGSTKTYSSLTEGIQAQVKIIKNVAGGTSPSYKAGSKPTCALGSEAYNGYLYQYLRIYATGARASNAYLNAIIGYFKANGKTITAKTTMSEIYNMI